LDRAPMELVRGRMVAREDAFQNDRPRPKPRWTSESEERLDRVPNFVRGMVKRIYTDYAKERGIPEITPAVMDQARIDLGLEGM
jgi:Proto-chlorophyllide reductase 57 kD subunit